MPFGPFKKKEPEKKKEEKIDEEKKATDEKPEEQVHTCLFEWRKILQKRAASFTAFQ